VRPGYRGARRLGGRRAELRTPSVSTLALVPWLNCVLVIVSPAAQCAFGPPSLTWNPAGSRRWAMARNRSVKAAT
jgi:hypothetical protein